WRAFGNSLLIAGSQTVIVLTVASLAAYYLSRFQFPGRAAMLRSLLVLHAFPVLTLIVPMFLMLYWIGLLDTLFGVILVLVAFELPFAIFILKAFFTRAVGHRDECTYGRRIAAPGLPTGGTSAGQERASRHISLHLHPRLGGAHPRLHLPRPAHRRW